MTRDEFQTKHHDEIIDTLNGGIETTTAFDDDMYERYQSEMPLQIGYNGDNYDWYMDKLAEDFGYLVE